MTAAGRSALPAAFGAAAGTLFAAWLYGAAVIDPRSIGWLLHGDPAQHYLGLAYFLNQPWHWPPGLVLQFGAPTSVVFTDSIPLLALAAKAVGAEGRWQYFGAWMVACHALAGWFGARLVQRFGAGAMASAAGTLFFIVSPALLLRAYGHESLMGQFLVLAALERALRPQWQARGWLVLAAVALLVHAYLSAMVLALAAAAAAGAWANGRERAGVLARQFAAGGGVMAAAAWAAGYFVGAADYAAAGYGHFSANLLTWIDPMDWAAFNRFWGREVPYAREWSRFLPAQQQATSGQYEGFAFLGAGMIALAALAVGVALVRRGAGTSAAAPPPANARWVLAACLAMLLLAVSTKPTLGGTTLAQLALPAALEDKLGVFRAGGRFVWPLTYVLMAWAIARVASVRGGAAVVALAFVLQGADLAGKVRELHARFRQPPPEPALAAQVAQWRPLLARCPRIEMVSARHPGEGWVVPALAAAEAGAMFTPAPTARYVQQRERERLEHVGKLLGEGAWRRDTLYFLAPPLPAGATPEGIRAKLPQGMRRTQIGGSEVIFDARCAAA